MLIFISIWTLKSIFEDNSSNLVECKANRECAVIINGESSTFFIGKVGAKKISGLFVGCLLERVDFSREDAYSNKCGSQYF